MELDVREQGLSHQPTDQILDTKRGAAFRVEQFHETVETRPQLVLCVNIASGCHKGRVLLLSGVFICSSIGSRTQTDRCEKTA
jgi:hypothetical protein